MNHTQRLFRALTLLASITAVFVIVLGINELRRGAHLGADTPPQATIIVSGEGEVFAVPDIATFSFGVTEEADTVQEAQRAASALMNEAIAFLEDEDVDETDIKTVSFNAFPRYEFRQERVTCVTFPCPQPPGERVLVGFQVSQEVQVKIRDVERAGNILSGISELNVTNISGLSFTIDEEDKLQREARQQAINEAKKKARALAKDLDVKLVRVISFNESGSQPAFRRSFAEDAAFGGAASVVPEIPVGENRIVSHVTVVYEIR